MVNNMIIHLKIVKAVKLCDISLRLNITILHFDCISQCYIKEGAFLPSLYLVSATSPAVSQDRSISKDPKNLPMFSHVCRCVWGSGDEQRMRSSLSGAFRKQTIGPIVPSPPSAP